jgi:hypothetical protein
MIIDVSVFPTTSEGDHIIPADHEPHIRGEYHAAGVEMKNLQTGDRIWSVGKSEHNGRIFASYTTKFYENKHYECIWLR